MIYLASGGFWLSATQGVLLVSGLLFTLVLANTLTKDAYGIYRLILAVAGILGVITLPGLNTALVRSVARGEASVLRNITRTRIGWGFLGTIICAAVALYYFTNGNIELAIAFGILGVFLPFFDTFTTAVSDLQGRKEFKKSSLYTVVITVLATLVCVIAALVTKNVFAVLISYFGAYSLLRFIVYLIVASKRSEGAAQPALLAQIRTYGKHLSAMNVLTNAASNIDKVIIFYMLGPASLALYAIAISVPEQLKNVFRNIIPLLTPKLAVLSHDATKRALPTIYTHLLLLFLLALFVSIIYILLAPTLFALLLPAYGEALLYSQIFALSIGVSVVFLPLGIFQAQERTKELYLLNTVHPIVQILLYIGLISLFGLWGAISAWIMGRLFNLGYTLFLFHRAY